MQCFVQLASQRIAKQVAQKFFQVFTLGKGLVRLRNQTESCLK